MADRSIALTNTLNDFRRELNGTAADVGDIADVLSASGFIASATDVVEAIVLINTELPEIKTDAFIFPGRVMAFEGATDDAFETTITFTEPTGDRTHTLPDSNGSILLETNSDTSTNKTFTSPTITSSVLGQGSWYSFEIENTGIYKLSKSFLNMRNHFDDLYFGLNKWDLFSVFLTFVDVLHSNYLLRVLVLTLVNRRILS